MSFHCDSQRKAVEYFIKTPYVKQRGSLRPQPLADVWLYPIFIPDASCSSHNSLWLPSNKHAGCWCFLWQSPWISRTRWREIFPDSLGKPQLVPPWFSKDKRSKVNGTSWLVDAVLKQSLCIQNKTFSEGLIGSTRKQTLNAQSCNVFSSTCDEVPRIHRWTKKAILSDKSSWHSRPSSEGYECFYNRISDQFLFQICPLCSHLSANSTIQFDWLAIHPFISERGSESHDCLGEIF